jgi:hypothetical protein
MEVSMSERELIERIKGVQANLIECIEELKDIAECDTLNGGWAKGHVISPMENHVHDDHDRYSYVSSLDDWIKITEKRDNKKNAE